MATAPQLELRDGSGYATTLYFTTNQESVTLRGTLSPDTVAVQVSINGGAFVTDPNLLKLELDTFVFPNPSSYPSGFTLVRGVNTIVFRAIDIVGSVSTPATATINYVISALTTTLGTLSVVPTGIKVQRRRDAVDILASKPLDVAVGVVFKGYNFYASTTPAGATGYYRLNDNVVSALSSTVEEQQNNEYAFLAVWPDSNRQFLRIRVTEEDEFGNELAVRLDDLRSIEEVIDRTRVAGTVQGYSVLNYIYFRHDRAGGPGTINSEQFQNVPDTQPLYYVVTSVYYEPSTNTEYESPFSQELLGLPLIIDTAILGTPQRTQTNIVTSYINAVTLVNTEISLVPGSTTRDVSIDPFASEAERLWFLLDFVHRSLSFLTLLQLDDANNDGVSDPVASSAYKSALKAALGYTSDVAVQSLIDTQFEKLARNVNKVRLGGRPASGQVVFYTATKPTVDLTIPANTNVSTSADAINNVASVSYRVGGTYSLPVATSEAFYNYNTKRYEVIVEVVALNAGADGNVPAGTIVNVTGVSGFSVTNNEATLGGTNIESNADLAARCIIAFASVDTGTEYGYYSTAVEQVGIAKAKIVKSGDRLMMRDWDEARQKHIGGKVDVWVQGLKERQVTENFAFSFDVARDIQCAIIDLPNLIFRVLDSRVTPTTPIIQILDVPAQGLGVRNATTGEDYDLTGVVLIDYQTFKVNTGIAQPVTAIDDIIYADYRFRTDNQFIFSFQPVRRVVSVIGEVSGPLTPETNYKLYKTDDPLLDGESTIAKNYLSVVQANGVPSGTQITVNDELHTLIGFVYEPLDSIGINTKTIRVFNAARTVEYLGPDYANADFDIIEGTDRSPPKIVRTSASTIANGEEVSVDYIKDENMTVTYVYNDLLHQLQAIINNRRHVTADVVVKQTVVNPIDIETTVQLKAGYAKDKVDPNIRTNVSTELNSRTIGQGIAQSDVINAVDSTTGVDYEIVPLAKMAYADGSLILREEVLSSYTRLSALDIGAQRVYLLTDALNAPTTDGGGLVTEHRGVFQDDIGLTLVSDLLTVGSADRQAFIIGSAGALIPGYTDDATLIAAGFTTAAARATELVARTANRAVVSISASAVPPDNPRNHAYAVSYNVRGDKGARDVYGSEVEYIELGNLTITYRGG